MDNKKRIAELSEEKYQVLFGVHKATFEVMPVMLERAYVEKKRAEAERT